MELLAGSGHKHRNLLRASHALLSVANHDEDKSHQALRRRGPLRISHQEPTTRGNTMIGVATATWKLIQMAMEPTDGASTPEETLASLDTVDTEVSLLGPPPRPQPLARPSNAVAISFQPTVPVLELSNRRGVVSSRAAAIARKPTGRRQSSVCPHCHRSQVAGREPSVGHLFHMNRAS